MNLSKCISSIIMQFGLYGVMLPFKNQETGEPIPTENVIRDVITTTTIPIYSEFVPWKREGTIDARQLKICDKKNHIYMLPAFLTLTEVKYVISVKPSRTTNRGLYGVISPTYSLGRMAEATATSQASMMLAGQMRSEPTFEYLGENRIKLYGYPTYEIEFKVACEHDPNGETIPSSCFDSFMELATLDVKVFLYNNLDLFDEMPTAFGNIKLKIEKYQGAEQERSSLLEKWRDTFHLDMGWEEWM